MEHLINEASLKPEEETPVSEGLDPITKNIERLSEGARRKRVMSEASGPYLFDVGVIALAYSRAPVRDTALSCVQDAITGDIDAVVPYPALIGAHNVRRRTTANQIRALLEYSRISWTRSESTGTPRYLKT